MHRASWIPMCLLVMCFTPAQAQERHLSEPGSGAIYSRSAFAHGYRHGYEEGYHIGNLDINMGRPARTKKKEFQGMPTGYSSEFGSRKSFDAGFHAGMAAGYGDGYAGQLFRAVDCFRAIAEALDQASPSGELADTSFDQGLASGYRDGFARKNAWRASGSPLDFRAVGCPELPTQKPGDLFAEETYCEGYRRGFVLGRADALATTVGGINLEASK